jgi:hypothetical protein
MALDPYAARQSHSPTLNPKGPTPMKFADQKRLAETLRIIEGHGPEARAQLVKLSDALCADQGGEFSAAELEVLRHFKKDLEVASRAKTISRRKNPVNAIVALAASVPGASTRVAALCASFSGGVIALSASPGASPVPIALTAEELDMAKRWKKDPAVMLKAKQQIADTRSVAK